MSRPRRRDKFWMVTWPDERPPDYYEHVPMYFPTRKAAQAYKEDLEADPDNEGQLFTVQESDEPWDAIAWPWLEWA